MFRVNSSTKQLGFSLFVFALVVVPGLAHVQFTRTASLAVLAGIAVFLSTVSRGDSEPARGRLVCAASLILTGVLIRWEVCVLAAVLSAPVVLFFVTLNRTRSSAVISRTVWFLGVTATACLALWVFDRAYYAHEPEWQRFRRLQVVRAGITDYNRLEYTEHTKPHFDAVNWSQNDLAMMREWFGSLDTEVYGDGKLAYLEANAFSEFRGLDYRTLPQLARVLMADRMLAALGLLVLARAVQTSFSFGRLVMVASVYGLTLVAAWFLVTELRLVPRVSHGIFSVPVLAVMMQPYIKAGRSHLLRREDIGRWAPVALLVPVLIHYAQGRIEASETHLAASQETSQSIERSNLDREDLLVVWGGDFPYNEAVRPLDDGTLRDRVTLLASGWPSSSPLNAKRLREFEIDNAYQAIYSKDNVYLAAFDTRLPRFAQFVCEHYAKELAFEIRNDDPRIYEVTELRRVGPRGAVISVRWRSSATDGSVRRAHEQRFGLRRPVPIDGLTWQYEVTEGADLTGLLLTNEVQRIERYAREDSLAGTSVECVP